MDRAITHRIFKNLSFLAIAQGVYKILAFITMIILARFLGVEGFGQLSFGLSFVWIFLFLADFGLAELFVRDITFNDNLLDRYTDNITGLKILLSFIFYGVLVVMSKIIFRNDVPRFWIIAILGLSVILDSFVYYLRAIFRIKNIMHYEAILIIIEALIKLGAVFFVTVSRMNLQKTITVSIALLLFSLVNFFINMLGFIRYNKLPRPALEGKLCFYLLKTSFPFAAAYILSIMSFRINLIMLTGMRGDTVAGLFSANFRIIEQFFLIPLTLSYVVLPEFLKLSNSVKRLSALALKLILGTTIISIIMVVFCFLFSRNLIKIIYGPEFLDAHIYLKLLSLMLPFFFMKVILEKILYSYGMQLYVSIIYFAGVMLNIILNFIVIPRFGIFGASAISVGNEILMVSAIGLFFKSIGKYIKSPKSAPLGGQEKSALGPSPATAEWPGAESDGKGQIFPESLF